MTPRRNSKGYVAFLRALARHGRRAALELRRVAAQKKRGDG